MTTEPRADRPRNHVEFSEVACRLRRMVRTLQQLAHGGDLDESVRPDWLRG